ncbi:hypothetical protein HK098_005743 [Nowakowskiella sp. JEL0407]|nr:hypothetical protein HK098_005743 [Nowakowskiella sp. JEL0407]
MSKFQLKKINQRAEAETGKRKFTYSSYADILSSVNYVHSAQIFVPKPKNASQSLFSELFKPQNQFYYKFTAPVLLFTDPNFVTAMRSGKFTAIATSNQKRDLICVENGILKMEFGKDSFETVGLNGKSIGDVFCVEIDISSPEFKPKQKTYDRLRWVCENTFTESFDWIANLTSISNGESMEMKFPERTVSKIEKKPIIQNESILESIWFPDSEVISRIVLSIEGEEPKKKRKEVSVEVVEDIEQFVEWVGLCCIDSPRIKVNDSIDPYLAVYEPPKPCEKVDLISLTFRGLISNSFLENVIEKIGAVIQEQTIPYALLCFWELDLIPINSVSIKPGFKTRNEMKWKDMAEFMVDEDRRGKVGTFVIRNDNDGLFICD